MLNLEYDPDHWVPIEKQWIEGGVNSIIGFSSLMASAWVALLGDIPWVGAVGILRM